MIARLGRRHPVTGPILDSENGRIPFVFRLGVVGDWQPAEPAAVLAAADEAIHQITECLLGARAASARFLVVSTLREGGEQLLAAILVDKLGAELEVVFPRPEDEYRAELGTPEARALYGRLRQQAQTIRLASARLTPEEGYEEAGRYIVDHCDAVVVLGDGDSSRGRSRTPPVLARIQQEKVPLVRVQAAANTECAMHHAGGRRAQDIRQVADEFGRYNAETVRESAMLASAKQARLVPGDPAVAESESFFRARRSVAEWVARYYARADFLAVRLEGHFKKLSETIFLLAAAAVAVVTVQYVFFNKQHLIVAGEAVLLLALLAVTVMTRRRRVLDRWTAYRFLAEHLRSSYFMALARQDDCARRPQSPASLSSPAAGWAWRALTEVLAGQPVVCIGPSDTRALADYLGEKWIQAQIDYHRKTARRQACDDRLAQATVALFAFTLVASISHIILGTQFPWEGLTVFLSIFLPALGAAIQGIRGIRTNGQYRRHYERANRMADQLVQLRSRMQRADSLADIRKVAADTEYLMLQENSEWFDVAGAQDMELRLSALST